jgi:hypothetical protein
LVFFDGTGWGAPALILAAWLLIGVALMLTAARWRREPTTSLQVSVPLESAT